MSNPDYQPSPFRELRNGWVEIDGARLADLARDYAVWGLK